MTPNGASLSHDTRLEGGPSPDEQLREALDRHVEKLRAEVTPSSNPRSALAAAILGDILRLRKEFGV